MIKSIVVHDIPADSVAAPSWATQPGYPFVEPGRDFVGSFLLERPTDDFFRDLRSYLP